MQPAITFRASVLLLLCLVPGPVLAIESCEKDGEIIFTKECINAILEKEKQQAKKPKKVRQPTSQPTAVDRKSKPDSTSAVKPEEEEKKRPDPVESKQQLPVADLNKEKEKSDPLSNPDNKPAEDSTDTVVPAEMPMPPSSVEEKQDSPASASEPKIESRQTEKAQKTPPKRRIIESVASQSPKQDSQCKGLEFIAAAEKGDLAFVQRCGSDPGLLEASDIRSGSRGRTALHWAIINDNGEIISHLLKVNAPVNLRSRSDMGASAIHLAAEAGNTEVVELLLNSGSSIVTTDLLKQTPLHRAAKKGRIDTVKYLLEKGAPGNAEDRVGKTPLISASQNGSLALIKLLASKGGDVTHTTSAGMTALHYASEQSLESTRYLIAAGADIDAVNNEGETPLGALVRKDIERYWPTIKFLVEQGASLDQQDMRGDTLVDLSLKRNHLPLFQLLLSNKIDISQVRIVQLKGKPRFIKALQAQNLL